MNYSYFLSANTCGGFYSIYDSFPPAEGSFLHIIKGGPGSGKSGFMRRMGKAAEEKGLDVHYILCSGDPDSLDGLYIPGLKQAWVDGTNPHVREPRVYGADSDYVNLSAFFQADLSEEEKRCAFINSHSYKQKYASAYKLLSSVSGLNNYIDTEFNNAEIIPFLSDKLKELLSLHPVCCNSGSSLSSRLFLSCIGCKADFRLYSELNKLCKSIYVIRSDFNYDLKALKLLKAFADSRKEKLIICPSPLEPENYTALIFPERKLAFCDSSWSFQNADYINADNKLFAAAFESSLHELDKCRLIKEELLNLAYKKLKEAKQYHDLLEQCYRPHIDFRALTEFTQKEVNKALG